jgi:N-ethylmaleimide reductase
VWDAKRVGIRFSPARVNDTEDSSPQGLFEHVVGRMSDLGLGFIHVIEGATQGDRTAGGVDYMALRQAFKGAYMANNGYTRELAAETIEAGRADLVSFGRAFVANPDLVERLRLNAPLNEPDRATFYGGNERGYTDYPALDKAA